ncbi:IS66 family transposase [Parabacteroides sp. OttesenSCG-928-K15]|nr:IS66 family transposase [Parabacteroides sp. OttesenSCG-928-K15]
MENELKTALTNLSVSLPLEEYQKMQDKLSSLLQELSDVNQELLAERAESNRLRWRLATLSRFCWSPSSEKRRLPEDPAQLRICFKDAPLGVDRVEEEKKEQREVKKQEAYSRFRKSFKEKKTSHARRPIPENLPRVKNVLEPQVDLTGAIRMGDEVTERYAIQPRMLYVEQLVRPRYKLPDGSIVIASLPQMAHPRSNASESALAHIAVAKYADHLPLNRQIEIFSREGVHLAASTVSNWMTATAQCIEPIYNELRETLKQTRYVQADETPHKVLEAEKPGALHQGYMWAFYLPHCKSPYFEYHKGRNSSALGTLLSGKTQIIQSDGFSVYDIFDKLKDKVHLCCWAHVRRKYVEAESYDKESARHVLGEIGKLYAVEKEIRENNLNAVEIVELRKEKSYPVIQSLEEWMVENLLKTPHDSPLDKANRYMYKRFEQLSHYINDAELQIDNNAVERCIRPLTLSRKNCLFSGSHTAAHTAAIFFSLFGACKQNNVNPYLWLNDCLTKVQNCNPKDYSSLLPHNWNK